MILSSNLEPPILIVLLITIPPRDNTEISVVSAPMLTTMIPFDEVTSSPAPIASATGLSTTYTLDVLIFDLRTRS